MTESQLIEKCRALAPAGDAVSVAVLKIVAERDRLENELEGERKANALLVAGMKSVCEGRDQLKHRVRELETAAAKVPE